MPGLLSLLIGLPLLSAVVILWVGDQTVARARYVRYLGIGVAIISAILCIPLCYGFDSTQTCMQFHELVSWIPVYKINYELGIDGISLAMIVLTIYTTLIILLAACQGMKKDIARYFAAFLVMQSMTIGIFSALNAVLFYLFWEGVLIPMYLVIGIWGGQRRSYAAIKFFLYTFLGSVLLLLALLYLGQKTGDFSMLSFYPLKLSLMEQNYLFIAFLLAFAIKVPMWPVHTWLPDAHTEAPAGGSVLLAALMLKVGAYGFLRFNLPILPDASHLFSGLMIGLSLLAIVYIGMVALTQKDMKRLIAYSSVAHMGFVTLGFFTIYGVMETSGNITFAALGLTGAIIQMISHAFGSGALFLAFGMLYDRMHTRRMSDFGGVAKTMPVFSALFLIFCLTNVGLPGTAGFVGEFMVLLGVMQSNFWIASVAALTLIISAAYTLWMFRQVFYGPVESTQVASLTDVSRYERCVLWLLVIPIFVFGIYPKGLVDVLQTPVQQILALSAHSKV